jgi:hypothetical protein
VTGKLKERVFTLDEDLTTFWEQADSQAIAHAVDVVMQAAGLVDPLVAERLRQLGPHGPEARAELAEALEKIRPVSEALWRRSAGELVRRHLPRLDAIQSGGAMPAEGFLVGAPSEGVGSIGVSNGHQHSDLIGSRLSCANCFALIGGDFGYSPGSTEAEGLKARVRGLQRDMRQSLEAAIDRAFTEYVISPATLEILAKEGLASILSTPDAAHRL